MSAAGDKVEDHLTGRAFFRIADPIGKALAFRLLVMINKYLFAGQLPQLGRHVPGPAQNIEVQAKYPLRLVQDGIGFLGAELIVDHPIAARHPFQPVGPVGRRNDGRGMAQSLQKMEKTQGRTHRVGIRLLMHGNDHLPGFVQ